MHKHIRLLLFIGKTLACTYLYISFFPILPFSLAKWLHSIHSVLHNLNLLESVYRHQFNFDLISMIHNLTFSMPDSIGCCYGVTTLKIISQLFFYHLLSFKIIYC